MKSTKTTVFAVMVLSMVFIAFQSQAVTITFDYQIPTDSSGKTSQFVNANNTAPLGYFIETFDMPGSTASNDNGITIAAGGGFNTLNPSLLAITGGLGIQKGSNSDGAAPAGDSTFYAYAPGPNAATTNATVKVDYSAFITYDPNLYISYLGMYFGSIDSYNNIAFYSGNELLSTATGDLSDGILEGSEILAALGGVSGNQTDDKSNVYVNLFFAPDEKFTAFEFRTTGIAFEIDNIVSGVSPLTPVPEPSTLLLLGGGLLGLGFMARRRK